MLFLANSRLAAGVTRQQLLQYFEEHTVESSTWDLLRHRTVTDYRFKVGDEPGVVLFLDVDSEGQAHEVVQSFPVVAHGLLVFEFEPVSKFAKF